MATRWRCINPSESHAGLACEANPGRTAPERNAAARSEMRAAASASLLRTLGAMPAATAAYAAS